MQQQTRIDDIADDGILFSRHGQAIFAYVRLHTPSREEAEDLTQEIFITALEHDNLAGLKDGEQLAWLRRVAHNRLIDRYGVITFFRPIFGSPALCVMGG